MSEFRHRLLEVAPAGRDAWADAQLGIDDVPADGELPRGCVPYLPSSVDVLLRAIDRAGVTRADVFVDVGSGLGRALMLVHLLTGAGAIGLEIQPGLAGRARRLATRLRLDRVRTVTGDAEQLIGCMTIGTVFFFYCPFGGERVTRAMTELRSLAEARQLRLCFVDMPAPELPWLVAEPPSGDSLTICRTR